MKKIALIYNHSPSNWISCQTITKNLSLAYDNLSNFQIMHFEYLKGMESFDIAKTVDCLIEFNPDFLIFIDHAPHPIEFCHFLEKRSHSSFKPEIIFHIFGDFTLHTSDWLKLQPFLSRHTVKFICASKRQQDLIDSFLDRNNFQYTHLLPFSIEKNDFYYSSEKRSYFRKINQIPDDEIVFLYTGRLSQQKMILETINCFENFCKISSAKVTLLLAGNFDNIGTPFLGKTSKINYAILCQKAIQQFNETHQQKIHYIGNLSKETLLNAYNASDIFLSLSLHNDEDFGMSPAEAISCGLPSILSDWAGYASFYSEKYPERVKLIQASLKDGELVLNFSQAVYTMLETVENLSKYQSSKEAWSQDFQQSFSIETTTKKLERIINLKAHPFTTFSELFFEMDLAFHRPQSPFGETEIQFKYNELYQRIYNAYLSN